MEYNETEIMTFGVRLRKAREAAHMSIDELSIQMGVSSQTIENWEYDDGMPSIKELKLLSRLLHVSIDALLEDEEDLNLDLIKEDADLSVTREAINLKDYDYKLKLGGRWMKKGAQKDRVVRTKFPNAKIYMLVSKKTSLKSEGIKNASFYLVNDDQRQYIAIVTDQYLEIQPQVKKISSMRFQIGNYELTNVGLIDE